MHTATIACCWVEGSVSIAIVEECGVYRERVPKDEIKTLLVWVNGGI